MTADASRTALLALALVLPALAVGGAAPAAVPCEGFRDVPGQGPSCPEPGGWRVFLRDGSSLLTHGPDPAAIDEGPASAATPRQPRCVAPTDYHGRVVYAVPVDKPNRWATMAGTIRGYVLQVNGVLFEEAQEFGVVADYKFRCFSNQVEVVNATLPTQSSADSFSTIVSDLRAQGYSDAKAKYWVWYDDGVGGFCGQGSIRNDDRLILENGNNKGNDFGITYGCGSNVMQHENGHNLGAVQRSAPDQSGGFHCNDGQDVMCYADGGSNSSYNPNVCTNRRHFDCDHDTYFHPDPAPGSYLATHWNLGSRLVRFIAWGCASDTTPPATTHALDGAQGPVPGYFRSSVNVTLSATDDCSSPTTEYRLDGGAWQGYAAPFLVSGEATHVVEYRSRDAAGNVEPLRSGSFVIDLTPPVVDNLAPDQTIASPAGPQCCPLPEGFAAGGGAEVLEVRSRVTDNVRPYDARADARPLARDEVQHRELRWAAQCSALVLGDFATCAWSRDEPWERAAPELRITARDAAGNEAEVRVQLLT